MVVVRRPADGRRKGKGKGRKTGGARKVGLWMTSFLHRIRWGRVALSLCSAAAYLLILRVFRCISVGFFKPFRGHFGGPLADVRGGRLCSGQITWREQALRELPTPEARRKWPAKCAGGGYSADAQKGRGERGAGGARPTNDSWLPFLNGCNTPRGIGCDEAGAIFQKYAIDRRERKGCHP